MTATAASLVIAGCGGSSSSGAGAGEVASFIPAGSPIYFEVSTDVAGAQWTQAIALAKRFPGYDKAVAEITKSLADEEIDFQAQIKPLLGTHAALGVFDFKGFDDKDADPAVVAAIDVVDGKEAEVVTLLQTGDEPLKADGQYNGVDLYAGDDTVAAVFDGTVVLSDTKANVQRSIDARRGGESKSMAGSDRLDEAFAALPDEVLAQGFIDIGAVIKVGAATEAGGADVAEQLSKAGLGEDAAVGMSISSEADGLRVKAVGLNTQAAPSVSQPFTPALVDRVPADALGYIGLRNAYGLVEQALAQARGTDPEVDQALAQAKLLLPLLGVTLDDVKNLTGGEHAVVVTSGKTPGVVAALETNDGAAATATLDALREKVPALIGQAGTTVPEFEKVELGNGVSGWRSPIDPKAGVVYGVDGNLALIGTLVEAVKQVQTPGASLADDPAFQAATRQMPSKVDGVFWVNGEQILTALDTFGLLNDVDAEVVANLRPLKNLAAWSTGGDKPVFEMFLTIK